MKKPVSRILSILSTIAVAFAMAACGGPEPEPTPTPTPQPGPDNPNPPTPTTVAVTGVSVSLSTITLTEEGTQTLTATVTPSDATNKAITWKSSDATVASVDANGKVTALKPGTATITVTTTDGGKTATCTVTVEAKVIAVTGVKIDKETLELVEGDEATLAATVEPEDATDKTYTWSSSDDTVVTIDEEGKVIAVAPGTATITVTTTDGEKTASCEVTVEAKVIPVESVTVDKTTIELTEGDETVITATVAPEDATDKTYTWTSSDESVVTVDAEGNVVAIAAGTATLTVTTTDGEKTATCEVTVEAKVYPVEEVEADEETAAAIEAGGGKISIVEGETFTVKVVVKPENATNPNVVWTSSNEEVATVDADGTITAIAPGEATITATTEDGGLSTEIPVEITPKPIPVESIELSRTELDMVMGKAQTLIVRFTPKEPTNTNVTWESSDPSIVKVKDGVLTPMKPGTATVTVTTEDGGHTAECKVTVAEKEVHVKSISLNKTSMTLYRGDSERLTATIDPKNATNQNVTWSSSDSSIATVDNDGNVTAVSPGTATITAKTEDQGKTKTCSVKVNERYIVYYNDSEAPSSIKYVFKANTNNYISFKLFDKKTNKFVSDVSGLYIGSTDTSVAESSYASAGMKQLYVKKTGSATLYFTYSGNIIKSLGLTVVDPELVLLYSGSLSSLTSSSTAVSTTTPLKATKGQKFYMRFYDKDNKKMITTSGYSVTANYPLCVTAAVQSDNGYYVVVTSNGTGEAPVTVKYGSTTYTFRVQTPVSLSVSTTSSGYTAYTDNGIKVGGEIKLYLWNSIDAIGFIPPDDNRLTLTSSKTSVATISVVPYSSGSGGYILVKGISDGYSNITIKYDDGRGTTCNWTGRVTVAGTYNVSWLRKRASTDEVIRIPASGSSDELLVENSSTTETRIYPCKNSATAANVITNTSIYTSRYSYTYTNSNSSVVYVEAKSDGTNQWFEMTGKSNGTSTVSLTYEDKLAGIKSTYTATVRVRAYDSNLNLVCGDEPYTYVPAQNVSGLAFVGDYYYWYTADSSTGTLVPHKLIYLTVTSGANTDQGHLYVARWENSTLFNKYGYYVSLETKDKKPGKYSGTVRFDNGIERKTYPILCNVYSRFGIVDENYNGGALLPKAESSDTPPTITVKKDGTKKRVYIYDYDKTGSISNRLTRLAQANVRSQSNSNFKYEISFSTTAQTIYFYNSGANVGDTCDFEIAIKRYQESVAQLVKFRVVVED